MNLLLGDNKIHLANMSDSSIDAVVTDPPYGLSFMGKKWDYDVPSVELWREVLRVLKPGGHVLSFGGTRTYHRMVVNMEDAGFEIRDQIQWIYGSGFPKSLDISKAIDKAAGNVRERIAGGVGSSNTESLGKYKPGEAISSEAISSEAKQWQGWGTALKPANEPIVLARKPLDGTVAKNVLKHGVGGLNIDGCRIPSSPDYGRSAANSKGTINAHNGFEGKSFKISERDAEYASPLGRWPANVLFDEEAAAMLDEQSGVSPSNKRRNKSAKSETIASQNLFKVSGNKSHDDSGGASRFFYVAKASKRERGEGNNHPTVKPVKLMEYLVKMVTPPGGIVLDPFMGSGTTGVACRKLGFLFVGCESNAEYYDLAKKRIEHQQEVAS